MSTLNRDHVRVIEMADSEDHPEDEGHHKSALIVYQNISSNDKSDQNLDNMHQIVNNLAEDSEMTSDNDQKETHRQLVMINTCLNVNKVAPNIAITPNEQDRYRYS